MNLYQLAVSQPRKMLMNLSQWLEKADAHAKAKSFEPEVFLSARLAPDQFALLRQIQTACDTAKLSAARLTATEAPPHPDTETTLSELRQRVATTTEYLGTLSEDSFDGAAERLIRLPYFPEGQCLTGADYLAEFAIPNFYFHIMASYEILRHNGVDLGKMDYMGSFSLRDA